MPEFNVVIVFPSIICPRNFSRVRKKCDLSAAAFKFSFSSIWWYLSNTLSISCFVCDCMKKLSTYVMTFLLRSSGHKFLLINAENAAGSIEIP